MLLAPKRIDNNKRNLTANTSIQRSPSQTRASVSHLHDGSRSGYSSDITAEENRPRQTQDQDSSYGIRRDHERKIEDSKGKGLDIYDRAEEESWAASK